MEILHWIKVIFIFAIAVILAFGFWWIFGWFLSGGEVNPLHWWIIGKLIYLFFSVGTLGGLLDMFLNK